MFRLHRLLKCLLVGFLFASLAGCSDAKDGKGFDVSRVRSEMAQEGWSYVETLGKVGAAVAQVRSESDTGRSVEAFWVIDGQRNEKVYEQTENLYAVVAVQKSSGDTFAIVFSKARKGE